jgi:hypothetical protein
MGFYDTKKVSLVMYIRTLVTLIDPLTGLDPAGPLFTNESCEVRLCKDDANFTEAIITNANPVHGFGTPDIEGGII